MWGLLKTPKMIIGVILIAIIAGAGWYVFNLYSENKNLTESLIRQDEKIIQLESSVEEFKERAEIQERTIEEYLSGQEESRQRQQRLVRMLSQTEEDLQQCLDRKLPEDVLNEIFQ
ncbi:MAG: hypothetical protein CMF22_10580 [Idiomarinaceae bacterium]|nr:hypothetical protein [Idiomarinaceae bacterium]MBG23886.1 hypothetical protein [Idiomarinaceae bacterium]|tara:strand:+ start:13089 stop:13436 length:348 start_codon:yes stop_codon:yes gene_type:complete